MDRNGRGKIRVLQVTHDLNIGGLQRVVADIATSLRKSEYQVSVCSLREEGPLKEELLEAGIRTFRIPPVEGGADYLGFLKLYTLLRRERPDIIHTHNTHPFIDGITAALMAGVPGRVHTDHGRQFPDKRRYMFAERVLSHFTNRIVAVSESVKNDLSRYEGIDPGRIIVVPNGIDGKKYRQRTSRADKLNELGVGNGSGPILGFVGRLSPEKGVTHLLKAMALLAKDHPNALLLVAGGGSLAEDLEREVSVLGLPGKVILLGPRSDVYELMGIMDMFVLPSLREGLPLVLLEAMAASLPIIATDVGGNRQAVEDGVNGLIVRPQDPADLYRAMKRLTESEILRKEFSENSHRKFTGHYSISKMISSYERIYSECAAARRCRGTGA